MSRDVLDAIRELVASDADADDVLRAVVASLVGDGGCAWAGILFSEDGELVLGPEAGTPDPAARTQVTVTYLSDPVAELVADGCADETLLAEAASLISSHCLVGWDTGGVPWDPAA